MDQYLLLDISIKVTIILALTGLLAVALKKSSAAARHLVWSLALVGLLLLPFLIEILPRVQAPIMPAKNEPPALVAAKYRPALAQDDIDSHLALPTVPLVAVESNSPKISFTSDLPVWQPTLAQVLLIIWVTGTLFFLLRLAGAALKVRKILANAALVAGESENVLLQKLANDLALRTPVKLLISAEIAMPVTAGIKRPVVLLPLEASDWDADWLRIVLLHELAHIKRRDCLTQLLANIACAFYWFNPLVWFAAKQLRKERELACDDAVLALGTKASDYAGYLVAIAKAFEMNRQMAAVTVGMACSQLESRVRSILNPSVRRGILTPMKITALTTMITLIVLPLASLQATSQDKQHAKNADNILLQEKVQNAWPGENDFATQPEIREKIAKLEEEKAALEFLQGKALEEKLSPKEAQELARRAAEIAKLEAELEAKNAEEMKEDAAEREDAIAELAQVANVNVNLKLEMERAQIAQLDAQRAQQNAALEKELQAQQKAEEEALSPNNLVQLKIAGVTPEYIDSVRKAGLGELSIRQIIELKMHGIDEAYIKEAQRLSNEKMSARDVIQMKISGLNPDYINGMKQAGFDNLSLRKLSHMRLVGVTPEFAASIKRAGYDNLSPDQLTQFRLHSITPEYIQQTQSWGFGKLPANELIHTKIIGVSPEDAKALQALGFSDVSLKDLTRVKLHGVTAAYVKEMRDAGFQNLTLNQLINMKLHGVDADYVKKMRTAGFKNISANQMLEMKIRGIDSILLKN